ncbi:MAG: hypothetical protein R2789_09505 [Microthrixaceae bacterium]
MAAEAGNEEVYDFLQVGLGPVRHRLLETGRGSSTRWVLERYAFGRHDDRHLIPTPNAGGLGMVAIGVGETDAVDVMTGSIPLNVRWPSRSACT